MEIKSDIPGTAHPKSSFASDVLKMASAPAFTQVLGLLVIPIIARLYGPEAFGLFALFSSIFAPLEAITTMGYSGSIMLPRKAEDGSTMFGVCLCFATLISAFSYLLIFLGRHIITSWLNAPELNAYLYLVPVFLFFSGLYMALRYWNMRNGRFGHLASAKMSRYVARNGFVLGIGYFFSASAIVLILGGFVGGLASCLVLSRRILQDHWAILKRNISWHKMIAGIKRYRKFPFYVVPTNLLGRFSEQIPIYLLSYFFSQSIVGFFSLGLQVLNLPMRFLGSSIGEVYFQRAAKDGEGSILLLEQLYSRLVLFGLLPFLLLGIVGEDLFTLAFGTKWSEAGVYTQILSFSIFLRFVTIPAGYLVLVLEKQELMILVKSCEIVIGSLSIVIGGIYDNIYLSFILLSLLGGLLHSSYGFWLMRLGGLSISKILKSIWYAFGASIPIAIVVCLAKWYFYLSSLSLIIISSVGAVIFYSIAIKQDEKIRSYVVELFGSFGAVKQKMR
jgi:O-antigen/teichoic acid export membrane protein